MSEKYFSSPPSRTEPMTTVQAGQMSQAKTANIYSVLYENTPYVRVNFQQGGKDSHVLLTDAASLYHLIKEATGPA